MEASGWFLLSCTVAALGAAFAFFFFHAPVSPDMISSARTGVPLVFIHGYKGSALYGPSGNQIWITATQALSMQTPNITLPLRWDGDVQQRDGVTAPEPLRSVMIVKVYEPWLQKADSLGRPFYPFAYDWRRDLHETANGLVDFLKDVSKRHQGSKVQVVAHSMGGFSTLVAMNRAPELFHSVLFAGTPFGRGIGFLTDAHLGTKVGLNSGITTPEAVFSFPSVYTFYDSLDDETHVFDAQSNPVTIDFYNADDWISHRLGVFANPALFSPKRADELATRRAFLVKTLERAAHFRSLMVHDPAVRYPPVATLASKSFPTLKNVMLNGPHAVRGLDFESLPKVDGDGRVQHLNSRPPAGIACREYLSTLVHDQLLNDPSVPRILSDLLLAAENAS
eukprot:TRINITY_DN23681_c0_g1_i1.p1 TRINITY_DN23681_c0_g1~~TRINITY_DN23681_c0_g1_i1.p1  ORF type:complete len:394 (-),score=88.21 TRINITY_DN23681_c0_g1_i1:87-1268(-)